MSPLLRDYVSAVSQQSETQSCEAPASGLVAFGIDSVGAECEPGLPIGLLLAERVDLARPGFGASTGVLVLSVVVQQAFRRQGYARMLLTGLETWARCQGVDLLRCPIPIPSRSSAALLRLTAPEAGWSTTPGKVVVTLSIKPAVERLLMRLEKAAAYQARSSGWTIAPFPKQQTAALQQRVQRAVDGEVAAPWDPDDADSQWTPATQYSRLLLADGEIIGWLITHFVSSDCLRYAKFWVDPGWEKSGAPLALLADVMRSAHFNAEGAVIPKGCFISHPANPLLHHWIRKQFKPVCDRWLEIENHDLDLTTHSVGMS